MAGKKIGVDIFQPIVPAYRVALFDGLVTYQELDVAVQASERMGSDLSVPLKRTSYDYNKPTIYFKYLKLWWQKNLKLNRAKGRGDVVVVCGDIHQISTLVVILKAKLKRIGVVWWGHHQSANARSLFVKIRLLIAKCLSDCMLCYTDEGSDFLIEQGFKPERVFATGNTIDLKAILQAKGLWSDGKLKSFREKHGLVLGKVLLFCSVLRPKTQLEVLIMALPDIRRQNPELKCVVIGDGVMRRTYFELAEELKVGDMLIWVGDVRDQKLLAPWFMSATLFTYPGAIGLSLLHALAYCVPVIVNNTKMNQMPEYVVFEENKNGRSFKEGCSVSLASTVQEMLQNITELQKMGEAGCRKVFGEYSMDRMVARFHAAIVACVKIKGRT